MNSYYVTFEVIYLQSYELLSQNKHKHNKNRPGQIHVTVAVKFANILRGLPEATFNQSRYEIRITLNFMVKDMV